MVDGRWSMVDGADYSWNSSRLFYTLAPAVARSSMGVPMGRCGGEQSFFLFLAAFNFDVYLMKATYRYPPYELRFAGYLAKINHAPKKQKKTKAQSLNHTHTKETSNTHTEKKNERKKRREQLALLVCGLRFLRIRRCCCIFYLRWPHALGGDDQAVLDWHHRRRGLLSGLRRCQSLLLLLLLLLLLEWLHWLLLLLHRLHLVVEALVLGGLAHAENRRRRDESIRLHGHLRLLEDDALRAAAAAERSDRGRGRGQGRRGLHGAGWCHAVSGVGVGSGRLGRVRGRGVVLASEERPLVVRPVGRGSEGRHGHRCVGVEEKAPAASLLRVPLRADCHRRRGRRARPPSHRHQRSRR